MNQIIIERFGRISHLDVLLKEQPNVLHTDCIEEVRLLLSLVLNVTPRPSVPEPWIHDDTRVAAAVTCEEKPYTIRIMPDGKKCALRVFAYDAAGKDITGRYLFALSHCAEEDALVFFTGRERAMRDRLHGYLDAEQFLAMRTGGYSDTQTFRTWLRWFTRNSPGELFGEESSLSMVLRDDGTFDAIRNASDAGKHAALSKDDEMLFDYLCHQKVLAFWDGFEAIRDMHYEKKPVIVTAFWEQLTEPIKAVEVIKKTPRQVIVLVPERADRYGSRQKL